MRLDFPARSRQKCRSATLRVAMNRGGKGRGANARGGLAAFGLLSCLFCLRPSPAGATPIQIGDAELVVRSVRGEVADVRRRTDVRDDVFSREVVETGP